MTKSPTHSTLKKLALDAAAATLVVFTLAWLVGLLPFQFGVFEPVREVLADFSYTDLYYSDLHVKQVSTPQLDSINKDIVLVNIGARSLRGRAELAAVLRAVATCQPRVVGLDAYFLPRIDSANAALAAAIGQVPRIVVGAFLPSRRARPHPSPTQPELATVPHGFLNFKGDDSLNTTIRHFRPFIHAADTVYLSWSAELVKRYDTAAYALLCRRHPSATAEEEEIRYQGNVQSFQHLEATELLDGSLPPAAMRNHLNGKLVLLGAMGEQAGQLSPTDTYEDRFFTPLNEKRMGRTRPDMYGVVIEANIVAMLLQKKYVNATPKWLEWALGVVICFGLIFLFSFVAERFPLWYIPLNRIAQFLILLILVYVVVQVYAHYSRTIDITLSLAALALVGDAVALYEALRDSIRNGWRWTRRKLLHRRKSIPQNA